MPEPTDDAPQGAKRRILFVDDDKQLLRSLGRMLWGVRNRWDMAFAESGQQALELLSRQPFDVIVADMRMPGMDGTQLLGRVLRDYPWVMRLMLSGDTDREHIMRAVPVAHQFLTKPVSAQQLTTTIDRGCRLRDMILGEDIKSLIGQIASLPTLPEIYTRLLDELDSESSTVESLARIVSQDMALAADMLKLVNSCFFGPRVRVTSLGQALNLLGTEIVKGLVLGLNLLSAFNTKLFPKLSFLKLWDHSLNVARLARLIAVRAGLPKEVQEDSFIAGLLHDLGKFVLADQLPGRYQDVLDLSQEGNLTIYQAERQVLKASHAEAGAYLLGLWGVGDMVLEAVAFHHDPSASRLNGLSAVTAVHAANVLEHELLVVHQGYANHPLDMDHLTAAGAADRLEDWRQACREALEGAGPI
jgi:HD-like signal output (HDOD) protein